MHTRATGGFTLLEMVVSVGIISLILVVVTQVFFISGQSNSKVQIQNETKQSGDYALSIMDRMIRNALSVKSTCLRGGTTSSSLTILNPDRGTTTFSCVQLALPDGTTLTRIASDSGTSPIEYLTSNAVTLNSTCFNALTFVCSSSPNISPTVSISFSLAQKSTSQSQYEQASATFQSTVTVRNE